MTAPDPPRSGAKVAPPWSPAERFALGTIVAVAAALRFDEALRSRLWFDEIYTLWVARRPLPDLIRTVAGDIHPPLHYLLVWGWRHLGGEGDLWIKSLSILTGVLTVLLVGAIGRAMFGRVAGLVAATLLALHPQHVAFSQESRSYALLYLLIALAGYSLWRWVEGGRRRDAVIHVLVATAALYTHYLAAPVIALAAVWALFAGVWKQRRVGAWCGIQAAIALLFAPQVPILLRQLARLRADHWVGQVRVGSLNNVFRLHALGASYLVLPLVVLALVPLMRRPTRSAAALLWLVSLVPVGLLWMTAITGAGLFIERYMFFGLPAWCLLLAAGAITLRPTALGVLAVAALMGFAARSLIRHEPQSEARDLVRLEHALAQRVKPGELVLDSGSHAFLFAEHYHLDPGRHRLLVTRPSVPYYEGDLVIPDSLRASPGDLVRLSSHQTPWWGTATRYGYAGADEAATLLHSAARGAGWSEGRTQLWQGLAADTSLAH